MRIAITALCVAAIAVGAYAWPRSKSSSTSPSAATTSSPDRDVTAGPVLVLTQRQAQIIEGGADAAAAARASFQPSTTLQITSLDAILLALDGPARAGLTVALTETNTRLEARANPMIEDLEGGDPEVGMREWSRGRSSLLRAATELARASWCAADGLCVVVLSACPDKARCIPVWGPSTDPQTARARFMAWPFSGALVLRVKAEAAAAPDAGAGFDACANALRAASRAESSAIALVVTARDRARVERGMWGRDLHAAFKRWRVLSAIVKNEEGKAVGGPEPPPPQTLLDGAARRTDTPPIELADDELLVVPKLASLVTPAAFVAEVERIAADARVIVSPAR